MRIRRRIRNYSMCVFLYGCLVYMIALTFLLHYQRFALNQDDIQTDLYPDEFQTYFNTGEFRTTTYRKRFRTNHNSSIGIVPSISNESIVIMKMNCTKGAISTILNNVTITTLMDIQSNNTLRRWVKSRPVVFLHIGKSGGTSFDSAMAPIVSKLGGRYIGKRHFDWSRIDTIKNPDVLVLLRHPVSRAVSHFYFSKKRRILKTDNLSLSEYLRNPQVMLETRDIWQDGQASVSWLTGTHIANWVGIQPRQVKDREIKSLDHQTMCKVAAERLRQTLWFGFLSDQDRSFELLQWQLGYPQKIKLLKQNMTPHSNKTSQVQQLLESLMPMDMWLYNYAKLLFDARWKQYKTGVYKEPEHPPFPEIKCKSTRYILACNSKSRFGPLYHVWNTTLENTQQQMKLLPKSDWVY